MEKFHDLGAVLSELYVPPADIDRSIVSIARAQRASARTNCACLDSRVDAACGSGNADQSAVSVPSELVSPLAAPFAGSCGLSPWICCTENTLVREYYRSRDSIRSYTRTTHFCPSTSTISLPHRRYSWRAVFATSGPSQDPPLPPIKRQIRTGPRYRNNVQRIPANAEQVCPSRYEISLSSRGKISFRDGCLLDSLGPTAAISCYELIAARSIFYLRDEIKSNGFKSVLSARRISFI